METTVSRRPSVHGGDDDEASKEEKRALDHRGDRLQGSPKEETSAEVENASPQREKEDLKVERSSPGPDSLMSSLNQNNQHDRLESARAEMGEVKEENKRLKMYLDRIMKEYKTLKMQFLDVIKQEDHALTVNHQPEEHDLVSLSLGPCSSFSPEKDDVKNKQLSSQARSVNTSGDQMAEKEDLQLSLDCKFEAASKSRTKRSPSLVNISPENSFEDQEEENGEVWPPSKALKTRRSGDEEVSQQQNPSAKKARVSVRARCDTPTMNDGCQWRKYGQKIAKGNPCPRAYYRCTVAPSCPVKKQVQRCIDDMSILITTYEGTHNHPLPASATAMASTTSAAASMLLSGSSTSQSSGQGATPNALTDLHGLNFCLSDPSRIKQFYLPSNTTSMASAPTHPTITLDLTNPNPISASSPFNRFSSSTYPPASSRYTSSTSLSFGSSQEPTTALPISWGNGMLNYGNHQLYNKSQPQESFHHQPYLPKTNPQDSIAAATKAITTDPNFQSALAAALKSIIGGNTAATGTGSTTGNNNFLGGGDGFGQRLRWNENNLINSSVFAQTLQATGCASSFLNKSNPSSNSHQPGNLMFVHSSASSLQLANPKSGASTTTSPGDSRNHPKLL